MDIGWILLPKCAKSSGNYIATIEGFNQSGWQTYKIWVLDEVTRTKSVYLIQSLEDGYITDWHKQNKGTWLKQYNQYLIHFFTTSYTMTENLYEFVI
jgi:hypothetical protein